MWRPPRRHSEARPGTWNPHPKPWDSRTVSESCSASENLTSSVLPVKAAPKQMKEAVAAQMPGCPPEPLVCCLAQAGQAGDNVCGCGKAQNRTCAQLPSHVLGLRIPGPPWLSLRRGWYEEGAEERSPAGAPSPVPWMTRLYSDSMTCSCPCCPSGHLPSARKPSHRNLKLPHHQIAIKKHQHGSSHHGSGVNELD